MLVLGGGAVLIGISERTTAAGVERLARRLFAGGEVDRIVALRMPETRALMHLDTVMTMVDPETFTKYAGLGMLPAYTVRPGDNEKELHVTDHEPERHARRDRRRARAGEIRVLTAEQDVHAAEREQWDDGCNTLAVAPGVVVTYERNVTTNTFLRRHGIEVLEIPGGELGRGPGRAAVHELPDPAGPGVIVDSSRPTRSSDLTGPGHTDGSGSAAPTSAPRSSRRTAGWSRCSATPSRRRRSAAAAGGRRWCCSATRSRCRPGCAGRARPGPGVYAHQVVRLPAPRRTVGRLPRGDHRAAHRPDARRRRAVPARDGVPGAGPRVVDRAAPLAPTTASSWRPTGTRWPGGHHDGLFQMLTWERGDDGWVYAFTTGFQRAARADPAPGAGGPGDRPSRLADAGASTPTAGPGASRRRSRCPGGSASCRCGGCEDRWMLCVFDDGSYRMDVLALDSPTADLHRRAARHRAARLQLARRGPRARPGRPALRRLHPARHRPGPDCTCGEPVEHRDQLALPLHAVRGWTVSALPRVTRRRRRPGGAASARSALRAVRVGR